MANLCINKLIVLGSNAIEVDLFDRGFKTDRIIDWENCKRKKIKSRSYSFDSLVPVPDNIIKIGYNGLDDPINAHIACLPGLEKIHKLDEIISGYNWSNINWGTKWDLLEPEVYKEGEMIHYSFKTAWAPPIAWVQKVSEKFPKLIFINEYHEPSELLAGIEVFIKGCLVELDLPEDDSFESYKEFCMKKFNYTEEDLIYVKC